MRITLSLRKCGRRWVGRKFGLKKNGAKSPPHPPPHTSPPLSPALFPNFNVLGRHGLFEERALFTGAFGVSGTNEVGPASLTEGSVPHHSGWVEELGPGWAAHTAGAPVSLCAWGMNVNPWRADPRGLVSPSHTLSTAGPGRPPTTFSQPQHWLCFPQTPAESLALKVLDNDLKAF